MTRSCCLLACLAFGIAFPARADDVDFNRDVKRIFAAHCVKCHGADKREGGLRLDHRGSAFAGGDSGVVLKAGDADASELFRRIATDDKDEKMPPPDDDNKPLTAEQIATIAKWIKQGATWPRGEDGDRLNSKHWAFQTIGNPEPPKVATANAVRNEIDRFVIARLAAANIEPSPRADRYTLIKRLYYDLHGLPPSIEDVDAFVNDESAKAYESLVDRLLKSPHFGERWGRHWLDKARYADSNGYEADSARPDAWRYRDWVIKAVNDDIPFDVFTRQQLAGDLLPDATHDDRLATAFHRQTLTNTEGGTDKEQFRNEAVFDRVATTGTVWLGLTVGCAQCHTHKYDPITQREYYQLFAFYNNGDETNTQVPKSDAEYAKYELSRQEWKKRLEQLNGEFDTQLEAALPKFAAWETDVQQQLESSSVKFHTLEFASLASKGGATFTRQEDGSYIVTGERPDKDEYTLAVKAPATDITALRIEVIPDASLPNKGSGRADNGNFVLTDLGVYFSESQEPNTDKDVVAVADGRADFSQQNFEATKAFDGDKDQSGWAVAPHMGSAHTATYTFSQPLTREGEAWLTLVLNQQHGKRHTIGRFRIAARTGTDPRDTLSSEAIAALKVPTDQRNDMQRSSVRDAFAKAEPSTRTIIDAITAHQGAEPKPPMMDVRVISQRTSNPRTTHILSRGDFLQPKDAVEPASLQVLHPFKPRTPDVRPDRLDLANWLVDSQNPLTPRVAVNHVWSYLFGQGLVKTANDFGVRGERPSHPQLLDWLATRFRDDFGWSRKKLIKLIVMSATYQQSSWHRPNLADVDPQNALLYRQNRFRVEAEIIRDLCLSSSGLLSRKVGGPSVFPPMPADVAALSYANNFKWNTSEGEDRYRRGMYTFFKRTAPHPNLTTFDCPDSNTTCVERTDSNTPLQALAILNNQVFVEASQALAQRVLKSEHASDVNRIAEAFRLCVARPPTSGELTAFTGLLSDARDWYADHEDGAIKLIGERSIEGVTPAEGAAWVTTCRILLNMDEFIMRE